MTSTDRPVHRFDRRALAVGLGVALSVAVPAAVLAQTLDTTGAVDPDTPWLLALFAVVLLGMGAGGHAAAARQPDAPLANGAVAALGAYVLVQTIGALRLVVTGASVTWTAIPFFALLSTTAGVTGGMVADHRSRSR